MADINQVITLGIGTPASIKHFITFGLGIAEVVIVPTPASRSYSPSAESRSYTVPAENRMDTSESD